MPKQMTLPELMELIVDSRLDSLYTTLPARIIKYDNKTQKATVQPLIKRRDRDGDTSAEGLVDMAFITAVPVVFPSTPEGIVSFPIKEGWNVWLHFTSRSIDNYMFGEGDTPIDPKDYRKHHYSDCFATIGASPFGKAIGSHETDMVIKFNVNTANENSITLKASGDVVINTPTKVIVNATGNVEVTTGADAVVNVSGSTTLTSNGVTVNSSMSTFNGDISCSGTITASTDVIGGGKSLKSHKHTGGTLALGLTGVPT